MSFNKQAAKSAAEQLGFIILIVLVVAVVIGFLMSVLILVNYHPVIGLPLLVVSVFGGLGFFLYREAVIDQEADAKYDDFKQKVHYGPEDDHRDTTMDMPIRKDTTDLYRNHRYDRKTGQEY